MFKKSFLFRKWTPHCVTFLKWCKLFPAYHILPQWQQHWHTTPKGKQTNPQPKGCNRNVTSTTQEWGMQKTTQGTRVTAGKTERQSGKEKLEGKAVQEKERLPGKANCLLLFLLFFTFPKLHKLLSKYLFRECDCTRLVTSHSISKEYAIQQRGVSIKHNPLWPCMSSSTSVFCDHTF